MLFYDLVYKPTFRNQLLALPPDAIPLIEEKSQLLTVDPAPNAKNKKRLKGAKGNIYRIRAGDYRIVYTYGNQCVSLLGVDHRKSVYDDDWDDEDTDIDLGVASPVEPVRSQPVRRTSARDTRVPETWGADELSERDASRLPRGLDADFLFQIQVPEVLHARLIRCRTLDDLIAAEIPEEIRERVFNTLVTPNYDQVLTQADYAVESVEDFRRMFEGELVPMLLRLDPEQERFVNWSLSGAGPVLLKGAPGTGKSVVAAYRVRSLIRELRSFGISEPRILFTSYTNALVNSARQYLDAVLGRDSALVDVCTADEVVKNLFTANGLKYKPDDDLRRGQIFQVRDACQRRDPGCAWNDHAIRNLSIEYLFEEIEQVIVGRDLGEKLDFLTIPRHGRRVPLNEDQRHSIWNLYELVERMAEERGHHSFAQSRRIALRGVRNGWQAQTYDGVVVDEAQDLNPTMIRLLLALAKSPDRLFLTADSNQCLYGNGFRWKEVHHDLRFTGRTNILRRNFRSTRQIMEAAASFRIDADEDDESEAVTHVRSGPLPVALCTDGPDDERAVLVDYFRDATRSLHVGFSSCAVLVRSRSMGPQVAEYLSANGIPAIYMAGKDLDLQRPAVKVTTFHSAKGLEFPVVALVGWGNEPSAADNSLEAEEHRMMSRRAMYVAMTRAMYALMVLLPANVDAGILDEFGGEAWQRERPQSWLAWFEVVACVDGTGDNETVEAPAA